MLLSFANLWPKLRDLLRRLRGGDTGRTWSLPRLPQLPAGYDYVRGKDGNNKILGSGRFGTVYLIYNAYQNREAALKVLNEDCAQNTEIRKRFEREITTLKRLHHAHIVQIYYVNNQERCFIMEYLAGGTLTSWLKNKNRDLSQGARIVRQVLDGLACMHANQLLHRDLKPDNILFTGAKIPKLADFGLVKDNNARVALTGSGVQLGTPLYMSPEMHDGQPDKRSDLWALGVILYEIMHHTPPFKTIAEILRKKIEPPADMASLPAWQQNLVHVYLKALAKDPEQRYQSAEEMAADLDKGL